VLPFGRNIKILKIRQYPILIKIPSALLYVLETAAAEVVPEEIIQKILEEASKTIGLKFLLSILLSIFTKYLLILYPETISITSPHMAKGLDVFIGCVMYSNILRTKQN